MSDRDNCLEQCSTFGRFVFNHDLRILTRDHHALELPASSIELLAALLNRAGATVPHQELAREEGDGSRRAASEATRTAMRQLRQALRDPADYPMYIETVRGVGYRFIAPVRRVSGISEDLSTKIPSAPVQNVGPTEGSKIDVMSEAKNTSSAPQRNLLQWLADDASSVDFAVLWAGVTVPFLLAAPKYDLAALCMVPSLLRLGQRALVFRRLIADGVPSAELRAALLWASEGEGRIPRPEGWRRILARARQVTGWAFVISAVTFCVLASLKPWTWTPPMQHAFNSAIMGLMRVWKYVLWKPVLAIFLLDAVARPRPVWQGLRLITRRAWRTLLARFLPSDPASGHQFVDPYRREAEREVDLILAGASVD